MKISIRIFDILFVIIFLIIFFILIMLLIFFQLIFTGRPLFYVDERYGLHSKKIKILKFRSMSNDLTKTEFNRTTKFGKLLRKSSLDELPQLINVLKGDMSLIGPRPINLNTLNLFKEKYNKELQLRQSVKPGLSGYTQLLYDGNKRSWDQKLMLDLKFVRNYSYKFYFKTLILTFPYVIKKYFYNKTGETL